MTAIKNTRDLMNAHLYPEGGENIRRKDFPYYDTLTVATGTTEYYFFTTALGNQFLRNKRLPLAGSEVFFVEEIIMYVQKSIVSTALIDDLNELMQQSYLQISVDNRVVCKLPGLDFIRNSLFDSETATGVALKADVTLNSRKLPLPIILNSTSAFEFKFVTTTAAATAFNNAGLKLYLNGLQLDKLNSFYWDNLKQNKYQQVPVTYYNTVVIPDATEQTYELFANPAAAQTLFSQTFPLSDIQTFACQNIEVYVNQPDTPIQPLGIWDSRILNVLRISVDDVDYYTGNCQNMLSLFAGMDVTLTTTPDTVTFRYMHIRQSRTLRTPLNIPANSKVRVSLTQPATSLGITGEITVALRGIETRRVA